LGWRSGPSDDASCRCSGTTSACSIVCPSAAVHPRHRRRGARGVDAAGGSAGGVGHYAAASASSLQGQRPAGVAEARKDDPQTAGIGPNGLRLDRRKFAQYSLRQSLQGAHLVRGGEGLWCVSSGASRWATESPKASAMRTRLSTERLRWPCSISLMYPKVRPVLAASAG